MGEVLTTRLSESFVNDLQEIAKAEHLEKSEVVRRLLAEAIKQWRLKKALEQYQTGIFSLEQASVFAGISPWEFFDVLKQYKISINYDVDELEKDLKLIAWKKQ
ncbi:UPF0175 family protein [Candidatus Woesearchaeota archaeon]|nr:UPF0175 family protein [Candidatus Woesearchaeota archaeon]